MSPRELMSNSIRTVLFLFPFLAVAGASLAQTGPGDADGDGRFTPQDVGVVANQILGLATAAGQPDCNGDASVDVLDVFCIANRFPTQLVLSSPLNGEPGVALTRETILRFSAPLDAATVTAASVHAEFGGQPLAARLYVSKDKKSVTLFYNAALPASGRIRVTVDGTVLEDAQGRPVDADGDFAEGGVALVDFDTLTLSTVPGTVLCGRVFATELAPASSISVNVPLQGVTITADGAEDTMRAMTDGLGDFCLDPAPAGVFFVHIDGRTATNGVPPGTYYPFVGKAWESVPGKTVNTMDVFLPLVPPGTLQPVSTTQDTQIEFVPSVLAGHPEFEGVSVMVPADSLFADDGTRGGMVGIAPVPPDRMPGPLPPGLEFPVVITVQTDGATNFDKPVPACFPNLPEPATGLVVPAGTKNALYSFSHDTGKFEAVGSMTVTADERLICTDPGVGILAPGWHASGPPTIGPPRPPPPGPQCGSVTRPDLRGAEPQGNFAICIDRNDRSFAGCLGNCVFGGATLIGLCALGTFVSGGGLSIACLAALGGGGAAAWGGLCEYNRLAEEQNCMCQEDLDPTGSHGSYEGFGPPPIDDPILAQLLPLSQSMTELIYPYVVAGTEVPPAVQNQVRDLVAQADTIAGGSVTEYVREYTLRKEEEVASFDAELGEARGQAPPYPVLYLAELVRPGGLLRLRGETGPYGQYSLFVPRDATFLQVSFYDPRTRSFGIVTPHLRPNAPFRLPRFYLQPVDGSFLDFDEDGLADVVELVYGTDTAKPDTDGDGVNDGSEIDQGTNPLDGLPSQTGVIASADTPGTAVDVCALNDIAAVADSEAGVSVFNVFNGMNPTIIAQVDTPGNARSVACSGDRIVVADDTGGLAIIDISDPPAARIVHQLSFISAVTAVTAAAGVAYVGLARGDIVAVDIGSGAILERLSTSSAIHDLAIGGQTLFVVRANDLRAYALVSGFLEFFGTIPFLGFPADSNTGRRRIFVGGGYAYVTSFPGYDAFDVRNPAAMQRLGSAQDNGLFNSFKQIVANGSGLGVAAAGVTNLGDGTHHVSLYDMSDPTKTDLFLTTFQTPGTTRAVSIYNGLAYAADGASGLQVVNYLAYDSLGVAPSVTFSTDIQGSQVQEGALVVVTASVSDDVQVRNVELLLDGQVIQTDGNFPFELQFDAPLLSQQSSFTLAVRASDTGGNRTTSAVQTFSLVPDTTPPGITRFKPAPGTTLYGPFTATVAFSEPMDSATLDTSGVRLTWAGPDNNFGTGDDQALVPAISVVANDRHIVVHNTGQDPLGKLRLTLDGTKLRDRAGNLLDGDGNGSPGGDFVLDLTRSRLTYGSAVTVTVDLSNEPLVIEFEGAAGAVASLAYVAAPQFFYLRLLAPDGTEIVPQQPTQVAHLLDLPVAQSGLYRIELQLNSNALPNTVTLGLSDQPVETLPALAFNTPVDSSLSAFQDVDDWPFSATAGQMLTFYAENSIRVLRLPDRAVLASSGTINRIEDFTVPATGQYLLQVYTVLFSPDPQTYTLSMGLPGLDVHPVSYGQTATDTLDYGAHIIWYELTATAGDVVSFTKIGTGRYQLLAPDGTLLQDNLPGQLLDVVLPQSGTYRLQIRTGQGSLGPVNFGLSDQPVESLPPLSLDTPVNSSFNNLADVDDWPLSATAGQVLTFTAQPTSGNVPRVRLLRASDRAVLALGTNAIPSTITSFTIPATGQYVVQVFIRNFSVGTGSGSYTLTVSD